MIKDFNRHSAQWGYETTNTESELVEDWAEARCLSLIHDHKLLSSFNNGLWRIGYNLDLTSVINRMAGCCKKIMREPVWHSQHPLHTNECSGHPTNRTVSSSFQPKKANWQGYARHLDSTIKNVPPTAESCCQFVDTVHIAARKTPPPPPPVELGETKPKA